MNEYIIFSMIVLIIFSSATGFCYYRYRLSIITKIFSISLGMGGSIAILAFVLGKLGLTLKPALATIPIGATTAILSSILLFKLIIRPIQKMLQVIEEMSKGSLNLEIDIKSKDEFGQMSASMNNMVATLSGMIKDIVGIINHLAGAAEQIKETSQMLSSTSSEQSANIEEISSSLEEIVANVSQTASSSTEAESMAANSLQLAEKGGEMIEKTLSAMEEINKSGQEVSQILSMINEISFQTNLLALNASVEAARAGEKGRGFAVVAGEVRNLAQRSSSASTDIGRLIGDSSDRTEAGTQMANESGESLSTIIEASKRVESIISEIANANHEIKQGISEINTGMGQLNEVSQENSSSSEELAGTADNLYMMMTSLEKTMEFFKL